MSSPSSSTGSDSSRQPPVGVREIRLILLVTQAVLIAFMSRQAWLQHQAVIASRPNVARLSAELGRMDQIRKEFARYGESHPAFVPILNKYGIQSSGQAVPPLPKP